MTKNGLGVPRKLFFMVMGRLTTTIRIENGCQILGPFCGAFAEHLRSFCGASGGGFETPSHFSNDFRKQGLKIKSS